MNDEPHSATRRHSLGPDAELIVVKEDIVIERRKSMESTFE